MKKFNTENKKSRRKTFLISFGILIAGGLITTLIFFTEPKAVREGATRETAMLVNVFRPEYGSFNPMVIATGTVKPEQEVMLSPRVSGEIVSRSPLFTPGGFVDKGEILLRIDPADYRNILELRKSDLHRAEADLKIEMGRQLVAEKDYQLLDEELRVENKELVLREPQLKAAQAAVEAARASVAQAELDLQRTAIRAPFDAYILSRNANLGSQVQPGENLGRLVGTDIYWIEAAVPLSKTLWMSFPDTEHEKGSQVMIRNRTAWPDTVHRTGYLYRLIGALEDQTRMARVLVAVEDPLAHQTVNKDQPPLIIGSFVEVQIIADEISNVVRLRRDYLRKDHTVWVMENEKLHIKNVDVLFMDAEYAYISGGLGSEDYVVTTNLSTVTDGAPLRTGSEMNKDTHNGSAGGTQ